MENISQMSLLEIALKLMEQKRGAQNIRSLIKETLEMKGVDDEDGELATQLYIDITTSSKFVYMGEEAWDLKDRQSLDEFDKDGSFFNKGNEEDEYEDDDDYDDEDDLDEEDLDDEDDEDSDDDDEDDDEDSDYDEDDLDDEYDDEDDLDREDTEQYSEEGFNEDKYNDYMDDYEDMYDEN